MFSDANEKIYMVYENQITSKQVYQILACFDKIYFKMTVAQRKRSRDGSKKHCVTDDSGTWYFLHISHSELG